MLFLRVVTILLSLMVLSCGGGGSKSSDDPAKEFAPRFKNQASAVDITDPTKGLIYEGECSRNVDEVQVYSIYIPENKRNPAEVFQYYDLSCKEDGFFFFIVRKSDLQNAGLVLGTKARIELDFLVGGKSTGTLNFNY